MQFTKIRVFLTFHMIIYTPFERSRRVLTSFVVFDFDQTYICRKFSKTRKTKKKFRFLGLKDGTFRI